jgi:hypothetical protein
MPEDLNRSRLEIVIQDAPEHQRVLHSRSVNASAFDVSRLSETAPAWSPSGLYVAVPQLDPFGLAIVRVADGRQVKSLEGAFAPSWASDGKIAFYRRGDPHGLYVLDARFGEPRRLTEMPEAERVPSPVWSRDSTTLLVVQNPAGKAGSETGAELLRVGLDGSPAEKLRSLLVEQVKERVPLGVASFTFDRDQEELFFTTHMDRVQNLITVTGRRLNENLARFNPLDPVVPLSALAVAPAARRLALRVGRPGVLSLPALCEPQSEQLTPIVPDDSARCEWLALLNAAGRSILAERLNLKADLPPGDRPTVLPMPGELPKDDMASLRLGRIVKAGTALCDRPGDSQELDKDVKALFLESRLFFDYLRDDLKSARSDVEALNTAELTPDQRARLLGLRAQIDFGLGDLFRARTTTNYLKQMVAPVQVYQETPSRIVLARDPRAGDQWAEALAKRLASDPVPAAAGSEPAEGPLLDANTQEFNVHGLDASIPPQLRRNVPPPPPRPEPPKPARPF